MDEEVALGRRRDRHEQPRPALVVAKTLGVKIKLLNLASEPNQAAENLQKTFSFRLFIELLAMIITSSRRVYFGG
jgi:hypothetical protein